MKRFRGKVAELAASASRDSGGAAVQLGSPGVPGHLSPNKIKLNPLKGRL